MSTDTNQKYSPKSSSWPSPNINCDDDSRSDFQFDGIILPNHDVSQLISEERPRHKVLEKPFKEKFRDNVWHNDNTWIKMFLILSCSSASIILIFEIVLFGILLSKYNETVDDDYYLYTQSTISNQKSSVISYLILYFYAILYQVLLTLVVLYTRSVFHLLSTIAFLVVMLVYSIFQFIVVNRGLVSYKSGSAGQVKIFEPLTAKAARGLLGMVMGISFLTIIVQAFVGYKLKDKFRRFKAENVGNNKKRVQANFIFNLHRDFLILDLFFSPGFLIQYTISSFGVSTFGIISIVFTVVTIIIIPLADFSASREKKGRLIVCMVWHFMLEGYVVFLLISVYMLISQYEGIMNKESVVVFGTVSALLLLCLFISSILVIRNFNLGLYEVYSKQYNWLYVPKKDKQNDSRNGFELQSLNSPKPEDPFDDRSNYDQPPKRNDLDFGNELE